MLVDTHCHIHRRDFPLDLHEVLENAAVNDVMKIFCVGSDLKSSREAIEFQQKFNNEFGVKIFTILGTHPHEAKNFTNDDEVDLRKLIRENQGTVKGIGEIGLDYFYEFSPRDKQIAVFEQQLQIAIDHDLPVSFHVRDKTETPAVFDDFWPIINNFPQIRGVMHSFTDTRANLEIALSHGFYVGVNGIITFNKNPVQTEMYRAISLDRILLETDAPFLAPIPFRGKPDQPAYIKNIAEFLAEFANKSIQEIAEQTTKNARELFGT